MSENLADRSAVIGKWRWDLRFSHSALLRIQMTCGSLQALSTILMGQLQPGAALSADQAALLIWAGESWREPKLTLQKVKARLATMSDMERQLLSTWAAADFMTALLRLLQVQLNKDLPKDDNDD